MVEDLRAKVVKKWRSCNRIGGTGGILKCYAADSERVMRPRNRGDGSLITFKDE